MHASQVSSPEARRRRASAQASLWRGVQAFPELTMTIAGLSKHTEAYITRTAKRSCVAPWLASLWRCSFRDGIGVNRAWLAFAWVPS